MIPPESDLLVSPAFAVVDQENPKKVATKHEIKASNPSAFPDQLLINAMFQAEYLIKSI